MPQIILSLISAIFIGGAAGYLGSLMITKRMGLVGGPLGHLALPGVALALLYHFNVFYGALLTIILGGTLIWLLEIKTKAPIEALTGLVFSAGVALGFLILPFSNEHHLEEALVGDITKITFSDTILAIILCILIFFIIKKIYSKLVLAEISEDLAKIEGVDVKKYNFIYLACIGLIVALTVKLVGGLLPVALIVIPALTARNIFKSSFGYSLGSLSFGVLSAILGIFLSQLYLFPAGLLIIISATFFFLISIFFLNSMLGFFFDLFTIRIMDTKTNPKRKKRKKMKRKRILILFFCCLFILGGFFWKEIKVLAQSSITDSFEDTSKIATTTNINVATTTGQVKLSLRDNWFDPNWNYRRAITIDNTNNTNTLTDYQVLVTLNTSSFTEKGIYELPITISSTGNDLTDYQVKIEITDPTILSHITDDGRDIRFFDHSTSDPYNEITGKLNFWIEQISSSKLTVWVKTDVPATGDKTIYMYYGNPNANSESNGNTVGFIFFDGFNGTSLDSNKWPTIEHITGGEWQTESSAYYEVANGKLHIRHESNDEDGDCASTGGDWNGWRFYSSNFSLPSDAKLGIEAVVSFANVDWYRGFGDFVGVFLNENNQFWGPYIIYRGDYDAYTKRCMDGTCSFIANVGEYSSGNLNFQYTFTTTTYEMVMSGTYSDSSSGSGTISTTANVVLSTYAGACWGNGIHYDVYYDRVIVRKVADPEPTITIGNENVVSVLQEGKIKPDCGDIRFTDEDGVTLLNYWIESGCNTTSTKIWVKVPSIPASATKKIYMYYGNPDATTTSNGFNTFLEFDDFEDGILDSKWKGDTASFSESGGVLSSSASGVEISIENVYTNIAIRSRMRSTDSASGRLGVFGRSESHRTDGLVTIGGYFLRMRDYDDDWLLSEGDTAWTNHVIRAYTWTTNIWYVNELRIFSTTIEGIVDSGGDSASFTDDTYTSGWVGLCTFINAGAEWDWWLVRKYTSPEPTTSVGDEETKYYTLGSLTSKNLLEGYENVSSIDSFVYNLSSLPANTTSTIQFSQDNVNWYDSSGNLNGENLMATGANQTIDLSALNWSGANFYYKIKFESDGKDTPVLDDITLNYDVTANITDNYTAGGGLQNKI